ncbi:MAG: CoA transferase, partial [Dehalococcoidia bacterium]
RNPRLIYCQVNGYGPVGEAANTAAYDVGAFWARGGVAASLMAGGEGEPPVQRGGMGDHMAGANGAGAVAAALYHRERTGEGQFVAVSLIRIGAYMMGWDLNTVLRSGLPIVPFDRKNSPNPIINSFKDSEGRWFWLLLLQGDRHWPDVIRAIGRPDLLEDPRFVDIPARMLNAPALVDELDEVFARRSLAEWAPIFEREDIWFAPVQTLDEVAADPIAEAAGCFVEVETDGGPIPQVATPASFSATPVEMRNWAPELGQDTEFILQELGYDWDRIIAMKESGAIP